MPASSSWLLCRVGANLCALPLAHVIEVMRPLPVISLANAPECVLGLCVMRGASVVVVDATRCVLGVAGKPTRFVAVRSAERRLALAVDAVEGALDLAPERVSELPVLLSQAHSAVSSVIALDSELLLLLQTGRVIPDYVLPEAASHARSH